MIDAIQNQLEQAYDLIQRDETDRALPILRSIVAAHPDNADAWWLLSYAVPNAQDAENALKNVLRLNPGHREANDLLDTLYQEFPGLTESARPAFAPEEPPEEEEVEPAYDPVAAVLSGSPARSGVSDEELPDDDPFAVTEPEFITTGRFNAITPEVLKAKQRKRRLPVFPIVMTLLVVLVAVAATLLFLRSQQNQPTGTTTPVATSQNASDQDKLNSTAQNTVSLLSNNGITGASTVYNNGTMQVNFCSTPGVALQGQVNKAMDLVAQQAASIRDLIQSAGIQVTSCAEPTINLYQAFSSISDITTYVDGGMTDKRLFRNHWTH